MKRSGRCRRNQRTRIQKRSPSCGSVTGNRLPRTSASTPASSRISHGLKWALTPEVTMGSNMSSNGTLPLSMLASVGPRQQLMRLGLNVLPPQGTVAKPLLSRQDHGTNSTRKSTNNEVSLGYSPSQGLGIGCGITSRKLELFESDDCHTYQAFREVAQTVALGYLIEQLESGCLERFPSGGAH